MYLSTSVKFSLKRRAGETADTPGIRGMSLTYNKDGQSSPVKALGGFILRYLDLLQYDDCPLEQLRTEIEDLKKLVSSIEINAEQDAVT